MGRNHTNADSSIRKKTQRQIQLEEANPTAAAEKERRRIEKAERKRRKDEKAARKVLTERSNDTEQVRQLQGVPCSLGFRNSVFINTHSRIVI